MKKSVLVRTTALAAALLAGAPALHADKGHDHSKQAHTGSESARAGAAMSSHDGMTSLYQHLGEMEKDLASGNMNAIHGHDEAIQAAVKDLEMNTSLTPEKKKRVKGYVKNVIRLSARLHGSADDKSLELARKDFAKLKAQVDLLDKQFGHSHKPGAVEKAKTEGAHDHAEK